MTRFADDLHGALIEPVRRIVLGGRFGEEPPDLSFQRLDRFVGAGGQWVETAHSYAGGHAEQTVGTWLAANPGALAVIDKIGHPDDTGRLDLSLASLRREATLSCHRLGVDRIDVLLLHRDDRSRDIEQLAESLLRLMKDGYAGQIGVSNWAPDRLAALADFLAPEGCALVASYQMSLAVPAEPLWPGTYHADEAILSTVRPHAMPLLAWAAHARGYFTGHTELAQPNAADPFDQPENRHRRDRCRAMAGRRGVRTEAVALAWLLHQSQTYPVIGPRTLAELDISLTAAEIVLSGDELRWLECGDDA